VNSVEHEELVSKILEENLGSYVAWPGPNTAPLLGPRYATLVENKRGQLREFVALHRTFLAAQDPEDLNGLYDEKGRTKDEELLLHWRDVRSNSPVSTQTYKMYLAGYGQPDLIADYEYWSRMQWFELHEALWLALGLDPRKNWKDEFTRESNRKLRHKAELDHVNAQLEQLSRFVMSVEPVRKSFKGPELLNWIEEASFPAHPDFVAMLRLVSSRMTPMEIDGSSVQRRKEDPRAVRAVARIITAIAIEEYGYDPSSSRSPIPNEIVSIMDRLGLQGSAETVLKYLKIGADDLSDV
jgi:hypothetical protein